MSDRLEKLEDKMEELLTNHIPHLQNDVAWLVWWNKLQIGALIALLAGLLQIILKK